MRAWVTWAGETKSKFEKWIFWGLFLFFQNSCESLDDFFFTIQFWNEREKKFFSTNLWFFFICYSSNVLMSQHFDCIFFKNKGHVYDVGNVQVMEYHFFKRHAGYNCKFWSLVCVDVDTNFCLLAENRKWNDNPLT